MHLAGYGCAGTSPVGYGLACLEPEASHAGFHRFVSVQGSLSMFSIWNWGSETCPPPLTTIVETAAPGSRPNRRDSRRFPAFPLVRRPGRDSR